MVDESATDSARADARGTTDARQDDIFAWAASELDDAQAQSLREQFVRDPRVREEFALASYLLADESAGAKPRARASAERVLARVIEEDRRARRSIALRRVLAAMAACLLLGVTWLLEFSSARRISVVFDAHVDSIDLERSGASDPERWLLFSFAIRPSTQVHAIAFSFGASAESFSFERQFPPLPHLYALGDFRDWPRNPLTAGTQVRVPPPSSNIKSKSPGLRAFVVLLLDRNPIEEAQIDELARDMPSALRAALGADPRSYSLVDVDRVLARFARRDRTISIRELNAP